MLTLGYFPRSACYTSQHVVMLLLRAIGGKTLELFNFTLPTVVPLLS